MHAFCTSLTHALFLQAWGLATESLRDRHADPKAVFLCFDVASHDAACMHVHRQPVHMCTCVNAQ